MDWRKWLFDTLKANGAVIALVPQTQIHGSGSLTRPPDSRPFMVLKLEELTAAIKSDEGPTYHQATIWVHDEPGSYKRIDAALAAAKAALATASRTVANLVGVTWQGESPDLSDPIYGTITKNASYRLVAAN